MWSIKNYFAIKIFFYGLIKKYFVQQPDSHKVKAVDKCGATSFVFIRKYNVSQSKRKKTMNCFYQPY